MVSLILCKLRKFHMTIPSLILLALASYRTLTSGESIQLVGICAAVVPFICQFKNYPVADSKVSARKDVISSYIVNLILMTIYLLWILLLTWVGQYYNPGYIVNPDFHTMLFIAIAADMVFISAVIPVCRDLKPIQRMIPGLVLTNGMLIFMMMAAKLVRTAVVPNIPGIACGFCCLIFLLTIGLIFAGYRDEK